MNKGEILKVVLQSISVFLAVVIALNAFIGDIEKDINRNSQILNQLTNDSNINVRPSELYFDLREQIRVIKERQTQIRSDIKSIGDLTKDHLLDENKHSCR